MGDSQYRIVTDMKMKGIQISARRVAAVVAGVAAMVGLNSCEEKAPDETKPAAGAQTIQSADESAAPAQAPADDARAALLEALIYDLGRCASENARHPELNAAVRNMLELLEKYYEQSKEATTGTPERVRLALRLADTTRELTAWTRACAFYDEAAAAYEAMPQELRDRTENKRQLSSILNGKAFCMMSSGNMDEAIKLYTDGLALDNELYTTVVPSEGPVIPEKGEVPAGVSQAATAVFSSYRCLGECQMLADDPEEARETLKTGIALAEEIRRMTPEMHMQYIRLLVAMGNLESRCGNESEVLRHWARAAEMCRALYSATNDQAMRFKVEQAFSKLVPNVQALSKKLNPENAQQQPAPQQEQAPLEQQPAPQP